ncbi:emp24/gp25L/p24 family/GOLD-domain-containing protein [Irpex lacteus]|nr:emp24/gp25L/p24 family/GOLD-domain-containing protein [Irpex lacteus]
MASYTRQQPCHGCTERLLQVVHATALTIAIAANKRLCFYADVDKAEEKLGFYFAVCHTTPCNLQSGGSFDIDCEVFDPNSKILLDGQCGRQGDYVLTTNTVGEYSFCFENEMSTLNEKLIDFDIMVENCGPYECESIFRLNRYMLNIKRTQK